MAAFNLLITKIFDIILYPFSFINAFWDILFLSFISSIVILVIYSKVSKPKKIKDARDKIKGCIFAIRIYKDQWTVLISSFFKSLFYTLKYFSLNFVPILFILPILFFLFVQMDIRYGHRPFKPGEQTIMKLKLSDNSKMDEITTKIEPRNPLKPIMPPVYVKRMGNGKRDFQIDYKLKISSENTEDLLIKINDKFYKKRINVNKKGRNISEALGIRKYFFSSVDSFIYPSEYEKLDNSIIKYISIKYPSFKINFLGTSIHWLIHYLLWTLIIVLALRKKFGVEF